MKSHIVAFALIALVGLVNAGLMQLRNTGKPDVPDKCYDSQLDRYLAFDETIDVPTVCAQKLCQSDYTLVTETCGVARINGKKCHSVKKEGVPYPKCCNDLECED